MKVKAKQMVNLTMEDKDRDTLQNTIDLLDNLLNIAKSSQSNYLQNFGWIIELEKLESIKSYLGMLKNAREMTNY